MAKRRLTNEKLTKQCDNLFSLVNFAISLAKQKIESGEELDTNPVSEILDSLDSYSQNLNESLEENDKDNEQQKEAV